MSNWKDNLVAHGYNREHLDMADDFVSLVASLLEEDRRHAARIKRGIDVMARKLDAIFPELEEAGEDELVGGVTPDELQEAMSPIEELAITIFIAVVGEIMLSSADGPLGSAPAIKRVVDEYMERRGWQ
jgi:hypothetical protein